jgi:hypothetical protein
MEALVRAKLGWSAIYRRGLDGEGMKGLLVREADAIDAGTAGDFANGTEDGQELIKNGWKQIVVYPLV